jgi:hypothetical protein
LKPLRPTEKEIGPATAHASSNLKREKGDEELKQASIPNLDELRRRRARGHRALQRRRRGAPRPRAQRACPRPILPARRQAALARRRRCEAAAPPAAVPPGLRRPRDLQDRGAPADARARGHGGPAAQGPPATAPLPPVLEVRRLRRRPLQPRRRRPR